jgi:hypothetical protein
MRVILPGSPRCALPLAAVAMIAFMLTAGCGHSGPPTIGSAVAMGQGNDRIKVLVTSVTTSRRVNFLDRGLQVHPGVNAPAGQKFIVLDLVFTGVGSKTYTSTVNAWSWLKAQEAGTTNTVRACGQATASQPYTDGQSSGFVSLFASSSNGRLQLAQKDTKSWKVAFLVPNGTQPLFFVYQGPNNQRVTWKL